MSTSSSAPEAGGGSPAGLRALVVDDEPPLVKVASSYLEREGFEVASAGDGERAVELARDFDPDVIVLDPMLPGSNGIEACRSFSDVYIVMLPARVEEVDRIVGLSTGADDYVTKRFSPGPVRVTPVPGKRGCGRSLATVRARRRVALRGGDPDRGEATMRTPVRRCEERGSSSAVSRGERAGFLSRQPHAHASVRRREETGRSAMSRGASRRPTVTALARWRGTVPPGATAPPATCIRQSCGERAGVSKLEWLRRAYGLCSRISTDAIWSDAA
jgi:CheY-like chemotaxis protein